MPIRDDFDTESSDETKKRQDKMGRQPTDHTAEEALDANPIELPKNLSADERAFIEKKMLNSLVKEFEDRMSWRVNYENLWEQIYGLYQSNIASRRTKTRTKIFIPVIFQVVEAALPKFINTLFSIDEFFEVRPTGTADDKQKVGDSIRRLIMYQLSLANFFVKTVDFIKQLLLYGTSYMKVFWIVKRKWTWTRTPVREQVTFLGIPAGSRIVRWETKKEFKVVERRPEIEVVDILDVYPHPEAENEQEEDKGIFIRSWISLEKFKSLGAGKFPVYANTTSASLSTNTETKVLSRQARVARRGINQPIGGNEKTVELLSYWGPVDVDNDGIEEEAHIVIANRTVLAKAQANQFYHQKRPLIRSVLYPVVKEWYGIGLVEPVISLQHELNTLRRMRLDNINLLINRMWLIDGGADIDVDSLMSTPNGIITLDGQDSVVALDAKDVTQSAYLEAQNVQSDIENATVSRSAQGTPESGRLGRTARGAQLIIGQALEKFGTALKLTEGMAIRPLLTMIHSLNGQFIDDDQMLQDLYKDAFPDGLPTVEQVIANAQFQMKTISDMIDNEAKINQDVNFLGIGAQFLTPESIQFILRRIWRHMGNKEEDLKEVNVSAEAALAARGGGGGQSQIANALTGQVQNQGAQVSSSIPGNQSQPGG